MSVKKPACECCGRVRKPTLKVERCKRCKEYVCPNANCRVPHDREVCGDQFANRKARIEVNAGGPRSFNHEDAFDPMVF